MYTFLEKLINRAGHLGNHVQKYVKSIEQYGDSLVQIVEKRGLIDQVHLWKESRNPSFEMDIILSCSHDSLQMKLDYLGCYYAIQFLHMNFSALDVLFLNLTAQPDKFPVFKEMQFQSGAKFRRLNTAYMEKLLDLFLDKEIIPEFVICGVGTRVDQDDLDIGIIDTHSDYRNDLNIAIGRLNSEMLKRAVPLHLYLSQYVGEPGFTASIKEYNELLDREIHDFIIISEMLGAKYILGNLVLFREFEQKITSRYYYQNNHDNLYHEGYLRGILGEVRSLLLQQVSDDIINPKKDGIQMIRSLLYAEKTMFSIKYANKYKILAELIKKDAIHEEIYKDLEEALLFLETLRFLYQLLIVQDEEISLKFDEASVNLERIAENMEYGAVGSIEAYERLLTHYFEYVCVAKEKTEQIFDLVTKHLQSISVFSQLAKSKNKTNDIKDKPINVAVEFANIAHFFRGTKFWDDVLITLEVDDFKLLKTLVSDLSALPEKQKSAVIERYIELSHYSFYALLSLIMIITRNVNTFADKDLVDELNDCFFRTVKGTDDEIRRLAKVFSHYPYLINDYLSSLSIDNKIRFQKLLQIEIWEDESRKFKQKLEILANLHCCASQYFKRFFQKVMKKYPEYILYLDELSTLKHIAEGLLGEVERHDCLKKQKSLLGDYYNIKLLHTGLELLKGAPFIYINTEFTEFSDTYLRMLFDVCKMEIDEEWAKRIATHDLLALYVTGGHGRGQAFDDDYDLIVVLNSDDPELHRYTTRIMSRMNAEIIKRGILPHFRFSEYTGNYVTRMSEFKSILIGDRDCTFIDKAQILGSRRVVGSTVFDEHFDRCVINPFILDEKEHFIHQMILELKNRHAFTNENHSQECNIKECFGGLRDIEMLFLILKAHFSLREPISDYLVGKFCKIDEQHTSEYKQLKRVFDHLKHLRDIYRLTVTADDNLDVNYIELPAQILGLCTTKGKGYKEKLIAQFRSWTKKSSKIIQSTISDLNLDY